MSVISTNQPERSVSCRRRTVTARLGNTSASDASATTTISSIAIALGSSAAAATT
jgi:hypothetical protein